MTNKEQKRFVRFSPDSPPIVVGDSKLRSLIGDTYIPRKNVHPMDVWKGVGTRMIDEASKKDLKAEWERDVEIQD